MMPAVKILIFARMCPRPHGGCEGPYVIQLTSGIPCISGDDFVSDCIRACIKDSCCRTGGVYRNKMCALSYTTRTRHFQEYFVKTVPKHVKQCNIGKFQHK